MYRFLRYVRCVQPSIGPPRIVRLSQITEDAENERLFGTEGTGSREITDGAEPELRVSHTVEVRARRLQIFENGRVQHAAGELVQVEVGVVRRVACRRESAWIRRAQAGRIVIRARSALALHSSTR